MKATPENLKRLQVAVVQFRLRGIPDLDDYPWFRVALKTLETGKWRLPYPLEELEKGAMHPGWNDVAQIKT